MNKYIKYLNELTGLQWEIRGDKLITTNSIFRDTYNILKYHKIPYVYNPSSTLDFAIGVKISDVISIIREKVINEIINE